MYARSHQLHAAAKSASYVVGRSGLYSLSLWGYWLLWLPQMLGVRAEADGVKCSSSHLYCWPTSAVLLSPVGCQNVICSGSTPNSCATNVPSLPSFTHYAVIMRCLMVRPFPPQISSKSTVSNHCDTLLSDLLVCGVRSCSCSHQCFMSTSTASDTLGSVLAGCTVCADKCPYEWLYLRWLHTLSTK